MLVTNDDGVDSVGIQTLAAALAADGGFDVVVVAPDGDQSGTGASLGRADAGGLRARRVELPANPGIEAWALRGTPAMCVLAGRLGGFGDPPQLVVSGINAGLNTGRAILHSGTVGAALTAQNFGMSGLAVSLQLGSPWQWHTAAQLALEVIDMVREAPPRSVVNLNVPDRDRASVEGVRWARLAPFGEVRTTLAGTDEDVDATGATTRRLATELQIAEVEFEPDTDTGVVRDGYAAITTLVGVAEAWPNEGLLPDQPGPLAIEEKLAPGAPLHETHRVPDADEHGTLVRPIIGR